MTDAEPRYRYEELVSFVVDLVENGALPAGSRLPSLRQINRQRFGQANDAELRGVIVGQIFFGNQSVGRSHKDNRTGHLGSDHCSCRHLRHQK